MQPERQVQPTARPSLTAQAFPFDRPKLIRPDRPEPTNLIRRPRSPIPIELDSEPEEIKEEPISERSTRRAISSIEKTKIEYPKKRERGYQIL
ncbi:MAG: hypothetical protein ACHQX1_03560 [Candidatus Micrarchaeales archaeon]